MHINSILYLQYLYICSTCVLHVATTIVILLSNPVLFDDFSLFSIMTQTICYTNPGNGVSH